MRSTPSGQTDFADVLGGEVPHDLLGLADVARDPVRPVDAARNHDSFWLTIVTTLPGGSSLTRSASWKAPGWCRPPGRRAIGRPILDRTRDADDQLLALAAADDVADDQALTCQYLSKIFAIIDRRPYRLVRPGPDIGAVGRKQQNVADVFRQFGLELPQQQVVGLGVGRVGGDRAAEPDQKISRLPRWSSTCAASSRASLTASAIAAAWSLCHSFKRRTRSKP